MAHKIDGSEYLTVAETVEFMGCTDGWVRMLLRSGKLRGKRLGERLWMISLESAREARDSLTTRSLGKRAAAKRPAAKRRPAKKTAGRRR